MPISSYTRVPLMRVYRKIFDKINTKINLTLLCRTTMDLILWIWLCKNLTLQLVERIRYLYAYYLEVMVFKTFMRQAFFIFILAETKIGSFSFFQWKKKLAEKKIFFFWRKRHILFGICIFLKPNKKYLL